MPKVKKEKKKVGSPLKLSSDEVEQLTEARIREGLTWKQLTTRYAEISKGGTIDERTIRNAVMKDAGVALLPARIAKQLRHTVNDAFDRADLSKMVVRALVAKFAEWSVLNDRALYAMAATGANDGPADKDDENASKLKFTKDDQKRKDKLWDDIMSFFFRGLEIMRQNQAMESDLWSLLGGGQGSAGNGPPGRRSTLDDVEIVVTEKVEVVAQRTLEMLEGVNARHRTEGLGHHRPRPEEMEGALEG